ncbi:hypothetical protein [Serratia marcescens]|uniref:hypothetical protein n=1 Tax=Serratia marcescens TaxID=615 RepID=UPI003D780D37
MSTNKAALLNLTVIALNEVIRQGKIDMNTGSMEGGERRHEHLMMKIGGRQTAVNWFDVGYDELRFSVWWDYDHSSHPQQRDEKFQTSKPVAKKSRLGDFVGACVSCWIERKTGKYIMGKNGDALFEMYVRRSSADALHALPAVRPEGYRVSGPYIM